MYNRLKILLFSVAVVFGSVLLPSPTSAPVAASTSTTSYVVTWEDIQTWTRQDAVQFGIPHLVPWLDWILVCEAGDEGVYALGSYGEIGPAQFYPGNGVWWQLPESRLVPLNYTYESLRLQIQAFVRAISIGLSNHWRCVTG